MASRICAVLCGGKALRLGGMPDGVPKPLVKVNSAPLLSFILKRFQVYGVCRFVLLSAPDKLSVLSEFAREYSADNGVSVEAIDTGEDTPTGGRIKLAERFLSGGDFFVTYGDGVSDIDINSLLASHVDSGCVATITVVRPRLPFGLVDIDPSGRVSSFSEKPVMNHYINGGFMVFSQAVFSKLEASTDLETGLLPDLALASDLAAYRHHGFWRSMDTWKDVVELDALNLSEKMGLL